MSDERSTSSPPARLETLLKELIASRLIDRMVNRFLAWRLPDDFNPDGGISFTRDFNVGTPYPMKHEPIGTNLFTATQAEAMVRHMLQGDELVRLLAMARDAPGRGMSVNVRLSHDEWIAWHDRVMAALDRVDHDRAAESGYCGRYPCKYCGKGMDD